MNPALAGWSFVGCLWVVFLAIVGKLGLKPNRYLREKLLNQ